MKEINSVQENILKNIKKEKSICLLAPSFVIDFKYPDIILKLRRLGFDKVLELTYSAKLISSKYHKIIKKNPNKQIICSNCPSIVKLIENKYPEHKDKLANITSPMVLMGRFCKKEFGKDYLTVFIGPCLVKKMEAKENKEDIDYALTFKELKDMYNYSKQKNQLTNIKKNKKNMDFDKFYNDYTKIYPITGALGKTIHLKNILKPQQILSLDGVLDIEKGISKIEKNKHIKFLDLLFCKGGCIGGPGIINNESLAKRKQKVINYRELSKKQKIGNKKGLVKYAQEIDLNLKRK
jgi:iron only hydrogenase large subunit-like protein